MEGINIGIEKPCDYPVIENGKLSRSLEYGKDRYFPMSLGQHATYMCNYGYSTPSGSPQVHMVCSERGWLPQPKCLKKCQNIHLDNGYFPLERKTFRLQEKVTYTCHTGFVTPEGQETGEVQCQKSGWTPPPKCITIECEMLTWPYGDFYPEKDKYHNGDVVKFTCANNYIRVGPASTQCYYFGWFPSAPECKVKARGCGPPPEITNGIIAGGSGEQYRHGDRKQYECNIKFKLVGSKEIECVDGQWSSLPSCIDPYPQCVFPTHVELVHNQPFSTRRDIRSRRVINYKCTSADKSIKQATCVSGKWSPEIECTEMPCGSFPKVANAQVEGRNKKIYEPGETIRYQCDAGFLAVGSPEIICRKGNWTAPPFCDDVSCGAAPEIPNAYITSPQEERYLPGARVQYECESNFQMMGGNYVTCTDREWSQAPTCRGKSVKCGPPPVIENGDLLSFARQEYSHGEILEYKCPNLYILKGPQFIMCTNGQWTSPPVCLVACTASEEDMARNNIELKWLERPKLYSTSGDYIEFRCRRGYVEDPASSPFRVQCMEGRLEYPQCKSETLPKLTLTKWTSGLKRFLAKKLQTEDNTQANHKKMAKLTIYFQYELFISHIMR
ncbi:hypothetical protein llap_4162 [Limosa lapponica baueri]|uniref:Sushi domain-containing protein n=1 Tax=Limosa lapponica baueri TaxID=1758121 RepID=A0A2I0UHP4_LIMLA|nr:hypothetical protein llap_4162 [Limosa lapponica baueri]